MFLSDTEVAEVEEQVLWALAEDDCLDESSIARFPVAVVELFGKVGELPGGTALYYRATKSGFGHLSAGDQKTFRKMLEKAARDIGASGSERSKLVDYAIRSLPGATRSAGTHYLGDRAAQPTTLAASLEFATHDALDEELRLGKADKRVIDAFADGRAADSKKLSTDGKTLDGNWMGGKNLASWSGGKIHLHDQGGRSSDVIARIIRKMVPKADLAEDTELAEKAPPGWAGSVKAMKRHMPADRAFALAWSMHKKGAKPHYKDTGSTKKGGSPQRKDEQVDGGCPCGNDVKECGCDKCAKLKAKGRKMREGRDEDRDFNDTADAIGSELGTEHETAVARTPGPIGKPNAEPDQRPEAGKTKGQNSISGSLAAAIGKGVGGTGPGVPDIADRDPDRGPSNDPGLSDPDVMDDYLAFLAGEDVDADDLFALAEADVFSETVSLPAETMAIANFLASKEGNVSVAELQRKHGVTETWAKRLLAVAKTAFRGAGVPRKEMMRRHADPARYFREKIHPVLVAMSKREEALAIGDGALSGTKAIGGEAGYRVPDGMTGGSEELDNETVVDRAAAVAAVHDDVPRDNKTSSVQATEPRGIGVRVNPTKYTAESINDYSADDRIRMAEAYDRLVGGAPNLSKEEKVDAEKYKALVLKHASRVAGQSNEPAKPVSHPVPESIDDAFEDAIVTEGALSEVAGHHYFDGKSYYADTAFMNNLSGVVPGMYMRHLGFGEFSLEGPGGRVEFDRMRGKDFPEQSGRSHKLYDDKNGKLVKEVIKAMEKAKRSQLVKEELGEEVGEFFVYQVGKKDPLSHADDARGVMSLAGGTKLVAFSSKRSAGESADRKLVWHGRAKAQMGRSAAAVAIMVAAKAVRKNEGLDASEDDPIDEMAGQAPAWAKAGARVKFSAKGPTRYRRPPKVGEMGTLVASKRYDAVFHPGPGGGLLHVNWDKAGAVDVLVRDVRPVSKTTEARGMAAVLGSAIDASGVVA